MSKNTITLVTKVAIMDFLKKPDVLTVVAEGLCRYVGEWSDSKVADHFVHTHNMQITKGNVAGVRQQLFGVVETASSEPALRVALERINKLEVDVRNLQAAVQRLELALKYNK